MPTEAAKREAAASRLFERAYGWLAAPHHSLPLCLARTGLGLTMLAAYLQYLPYAELFFGPEGIGGHATIARHPRFLGISYDWYERIRMLHTLESNTTMWLLYVLLLTASAAFAVGWRPRMAGAIAVPLHMVFYAHNPQLDGGWGAMLGPFMLYLVFSDCGAQLSVDAWLRGRADPATAAREKVAPWGMRLLQVLLCVMYLVPGFERLDATGWQQGEMVLRALINEEYGRWAIDWAAAAPALKVLTWTVLVLEPAAPLLLWIRAVGRYWALLLIAMHFSLELLTDTGWWQPMMISAALTFLPTPWLERIVPRRLRGSLTT